MINIYEQVDTNKRKSWLVIIGFIAFVSLAGYAIAYAFGSDPSFAIFAFLF
jgi:hypothetical protein